jgi:hypothetical protein
MGKSIQQTAFIITGQTDRIKVLMEVIEEVLQPDGDTDKETTIHTVPSCLQKESQKKTYYQLIVQQQQYLQESQNASIVRICQEFITTGIAISDPSGKAVHTSLVVLLASY